MRFELSGSLRVFNTMRYNMTFSLLFFGHGPSKNALGVRHIVEITHTLSQDGNFASALRPPRHARTEMASEYHVQRRELDRTQQ